MKGKLLVLTVIVALVATSCAPAATPTPQVITKVETKIVEKIVKETQEVVVAPTAAPTVAAPTGKAIKVIVVLPLTGNITYPMDLGCKACLMAAEETNAAGGLLGRPVFTRCMDDGSKPAMAVTLAHELCDDPDIVAMYGTSESSTQVPMGPILDKCRMPNVPHAFSTLIMGGTNIFQATPSCISFGIAMADAAKKLAGAKSVALIWEQDPCAEQYGRGFRTRSQELGLEIRGDYPLSEGTVDFKPILTQIKAQNPDVVFSAVTQPKALIVKQMREMGMKQTYLVTEGVEDAKEFINNAGQAAVGSLATGEVPPTDKDPAMISFAQRFQAKWGVPPEPTVYVHYQNYLLLLDAIKRAGTTDREAIIKALRETDYKGLVYPVSFNADGTAKDPPVYVYRLQPDLTFTKEVWKWVKATGDFAPVN